MREFLLLLPEIFLAITIVGIIGSEVGYRGERLRVIAITALLGLAGAFVQTLLSYRIGATQAFGGALSIDGIALFFKLLFIVLAGLAIVSCMHSREIGRERQAECYALVVGASLAMCLAASAADVLLAFLALQFLNALFYFLSAYAKGSVISTEAAVKKLIFGATAGALFLFGVAILFSFTKTLNIYEMHWALLKHPLPRETVLVSFMLIFLSLGFQFAAFPMYLWAPDVIQGAPTPVASFIAFGGRAAGFAVALRFFFVLYAQPALTPGQWMVLGDLRWPDIVSLVAGFTMAIGALLALRQNSAKRIVACLMVAETGFLMLGLLVLDQVGLAALLFNLAVQLFAWTGVFYVLAFLYDEQGSDQLKDLRGMLGRATPECIGLILCLVCAIGLPPFPGFLGYFTLIGAAIRHHWYFLALLAILCRAIGIVAAARLAFSLVGDFATTPSSSLKAIVVEPSRRIFLASLFVPMVLVGVFAELLLKWAGQSLQFILW